MNDNLDIGHLAIGIKPGKYQFCIVNNNAIGNAFVDKDAKTAGIKFGPTTGIKHRWHIAKIMHGNTGHVHIAVQMIQHNRALVILMQPGADFCLMNNAIRQIFNHPFTRIGANCFRP